jgi:hypothetical protein
MPDDDAAPDGDHGIDVGGAAGQPAEQGGGGRDRAEESQVAGVCGQPREEVAERGLVGWARRPDRGDGTVVGSYRLGSVHEPSMNPDC